MRDQAEQNLQSGKSGEDRLSGGESEENEIETSGADGGERVRL